MPLTSPTSSTRANRRVARTITLAACLALAVPAASASASPWGAPQVLLPASAGYVTEPAVSQNADGLAVAVFAKSVGGHSRVYAAVRPAGGAFPAAAPISAATEDAAQPTAAVDADGGVTVAWRAGTTIKSSYRPAGGAFPATPQTVASTGVEPSTAVDITTAAGGFAAIAWTGLVSTAERTAYAIRAGGATTFGTATFVPQQVASGTAKSIFGSPRIAADDAGDLTLLWQEQVDRGDGNAHYVAEASTKARSATAFSAPVELSLDFAAGSGDPAPGSVSSSFIDVLTAPTGRTVAVWDYQNSGTGSTVTVIQYAERVPGASFAAGTWNTRQTLPGSTGGDFPAAAIDGKGGIAIAYLSSAGVSASVRTTAAGGFQTPKLLSGSSVYQGAPPGIAMTPAGDAVVAWSAGASPDAEVDAARLVAGQDRFGDSVVVASRAGASGASVSYSAPSIALDAEGNGALVSDLNDTVAPSGTYTPYAFGFDPIPPTLGAIVVPAAGTVGTSLALAATATDRSGVPTVTWDFGDGGSATGAEVAHTYASPGAYTVTVRATDAAGNVSSATKTTLITAAATVPAPAPTPAPPVATPSPKLPLVPASPKLKTSKAKGGATRITLLSLSPLLAGDVVTVACSGKGCTKKASSKTTFKPKTPKKSKRLPTSLTISGVANLTLKPGATLTVTIARTGYTPSVTTFTIVKGKTPKKG
ncbi:MAG: PKD domain-containing protein [Patulibacter sp.]|nr:PKD domain-containing protein [Patulibacter sp.]